MAMRGFQLFSALLLFLCENANVCTCEQSRYSFWKQNSGVVTSVMKRIEGVSLLAGCCSLCFQRHNCNGLCYDVSNASCYVKDPSSSQTTVNQTMPQTHCYSILQECSKGYTMVDGHCVKFFTEMKTYFEARAVCAEDRAHLYDIQSTEEDLAPIMSLHNDSVTGEYWWSWVGGNDLTVDRSFLWSDGSPLPSNSSLWSDNEPSGVDLYWNGEQEDCVSISITGRLNDAQCSFHNMFVCQVDVM